MARGPGTQNGPPQGRPVPKMSGGDLLSHQVALAVPSALEGLTSGFEMGPGVSPPLWPPKRWFSTEIWIDPDGDGSEGAFPERSRRTAIASASKGQVLGLLVPVSSARCRASTSG